MTGASLLSEWLNLVSSRSTWKSGAKVLLIFDSTKYLPVFVKRLKSVLLKQNHSKLNRIKKESKSKHKLDLETTKKLNWKL